MHQFLVVFILVSFSLHLKPDFRGSSLSFVRLSWGRITGKFAINWQIWLKLDSSWTKVCLLEYGRKSRFLGLHLVPSVASASSEICSSCSDWSGWKSNRKAAEFLGLTFRRAHIYFKDFWELKNIGYTIECTESLTNCNYACCHANCWPSF